MLRQLPRALLAAGRRSLNGPSAANGCVSRLLHAECQRVNHAADGSSPWGSASAVGVLATSAALASSQTHAEEAVVVPAKPDPSSTLKGLKRLSDAKEVVLYQYATCPFCNKVRLERPWHQLCGHATRRSSSRRFWTTTRFLTRWWR